VTSSYPFTAGDLADVQVTGIPGGAGNKRSATWGLAP
jgi:hypothetical protein